MNMVRFGCVHIDTSEMNILGSSDLNAMDIHHTIEFLQTENTFDRSCTVYRNYTYTNLLQLPPATKFQGRKSGITVGNTETKEEHYTVSEKRRFAEKLRKEFGRMIAREEAARLSCVPTEELKDISASVADDLLVMQKSEKAE
jgi:hypothetical protein